MMKGEQLMLRAKRLVRPEDETVVESQPLPDTVHDPRLEETLRRLTAPPAVPPPRRSAARPWTDRAVFGLD
jgi:hypothetical protein